MRRQSRYKCTWRIVCVGIWLISALTATGGVVQAAPPFIDGAFRDFWQRTDLLPDQGAVQRTYIWGPTLLNAPDGPKLPRTEPYREYEGGMRTVQYFEKGRMELTTADQGRVTAGLLVKEMVSGIIQIGATDTQQYVPSGTPVVGNPINNPAPTYAMLTPLATLTEGSHTAPNRSGQKLDTVLDPKGMTAPLTGISDPTTYGYYVRETGHNIAAPFWSFLTQDALTLGVNGAVVGGKFFDPPFFAVGLPITEPYWVRALVGGTTRDVLLQAFERRILSYTPANPDGFRVEMGNVGTAYARWRYGPAAELPANVSAEPKDAPAGSLILFTAPGFTPDEVVVLRLTYPDGHSIERPGGTAAATGITRSTMETTTKDFPSGAYKAEMIGTKSSKSRVGAFTIIAPPTSGLVVQALPGSGDSLTQFTFYISGLTAGSSVNAYVSGPTGANYTFANGMRTQTASDRGTILLTLVPKSLNADTLIGPWAFIVQEPGGGRQASIPFLVNAPPRAGFS